MVDTYLGKGGREILIPRRNKKCLRYCHSKLRIKSLSREKPESPQVKELIVQSKLNDREAET